MPHFLGDGALALLVPIAVSAPNLSSSARDVENVLLPAHFAGRGLKADEVTVLKKHLQLLRDAAQRELDKAAASGM